MRAIDNRGRTIGLFIVCAVLTGFLSSCQTGPKYDLVVRIDEDAREVTSWPDGLEKAFKRYWKLRLLKDPKASFEMEAPYIRETANFQRYKNFVKGTREGVHEVIVKGIEYRNEKLVWIQCSIPVEDEEREAISLQDEWLNLNGEWHHVQKGVMLFPELYG